MERYLKENETLTEILNKCQKGDIIHLCNKTYNEKIKITIPNITIIGHNSSIEYRDYYNKIGKDNKELLTVRTYTLMVESNNVTLKNLTIKNLSTPCSIYGQAVALHVLGDNFAASNCKIYGAQDTILAGPIPYDLTIRYKDLLPKDELKQTKSHQLYENCYIEGDVDFIFGCGICFFDKCEIHSLKGKGYISAPSHPEDYKYGFVFNKCILSSKDNNQNNVYLARPWRDYGSSTFIDCKIINNHIKQEGFHHWKPERERTCKMNIYKTLDYNGLCSFANILDDNDINNYTKEKVLNS